MSRIDKVDWLPDQFARVTDTSDVLTAPIENLHTLSTQEIDKLRNTQARQDDVVRVLGHHRDYSLVMKIDGAKGWVFKSVLKHEPDFVDFERPQSPKMQPLDFLKDFEGVPYLWGGITKAGIDCSGLTQLYYFSVHDKIIPRNSREQRRLAPERPFADVRDHDLVFCVGRTGGGHHVGVYLNSMIWHSYTLEGVVGHRVERFGQHFEIQAVVTVPV